MVFYLQLNFNKTFQEYFFSILIESFISFLFLGFLPKNLEKNHLILLYSIFRVLNYFKLILIEFSNYSSLYNLDNFFYNFISFFNNLLISFIC